MNLVRSLNSIGKECFIKYFEDFSDLSISKEYLINLISTRENYKITATRTRVNNARNIFKHGFEERALDLIIDSNKLDEYIRNKAELIKRI